MDLISIFEKFGLPISFLIVMIWLFVKADTKNDKLNVQHRDERKEWKASQEKLQSTTTEALKDLTRAISNLDKRL